MAKKCNSCGGAVDGMFKKVCSACEQKANASRIEAALADRQAAYTESLAKAKKVSPSLVSAWEAMHELMGAKWIADVGKNERTFVPVHETLAALIPKGEKVIATAAGIDGTASAIWAVTENSLIIEVHSILNGNLKSSEVASLSKITGVESKVFNQVHNNREIIVTRAANVDRLSVVNGKTAEVLVAALNSARQESPRAASSSDPADAIRKLKGLLDDGLITQDEFDKKKASLLEEM